MQGHPSIYCKEGRHARTGHHAAERAKHGPAGVDDLDLPEAGKGLRVGGQAGGVPAVVTGVLTCGKRERRTTSSVGWA